MSITGDRLRSLRINKGWSQTEVADKIGVQRTTYLHYESGFSRPVRKLKELATLFGVTTDYILGTEKPVPAIGVEPETQTLLDELFADQPEILSELKTISFQGKLTDSHGEYELSAEGKEIIKNTILAVVKGGKEKRGATVEIKLKDGDIYK